MIFVNIYKMFRMEYLPMLELMFIFLIRSGLTHLHGLQLFVLLPPLKKNHFFKFRHQS